MNEVYKKFGQALKLERENKNLSLIDLSDELKISEENLTFIENGEIDQLPSELYYNLFAKSYAKALGIDYAKTIEAIKEDLGEPIEKAEHEKTGKDAETEKAAAEETAADESNWFKRKFITLIIVIVGIFIVFMAIYKIFIEENTPVTGGEAIEETVPVEHGASAAGKVSDDIADYNWNVAEPKEPPPFNMTLTAREECWVSLRADGDTVIFRNLVPWREYSAEAKYRMKITVAQPSLVEIKINSKVVDLRNPQTRRISGVEINQVNLDSVLNPPPQPEPEPEPTRPATVRQQTPPVQAPSTTPPPTRTDDTTSSETSVRKNAAPDSAGTDSARMQGDEQI
jgi:cytoskeleton protein RodZ